MVAFTVTLWFVVAAGGVGGEERRSSVAVYTGILALLVLGLVVVSAVLSRQQERRPSLVARAWAGVGGLFVGTILGGSAALPVELMYMPALFLTGVVFGALLIARRR